jgi:hypothetical protein
MQTHTHTATSEKEGTTASTGASVPEFEGGDEAGLEETAGPKAAILMELITEVWM